jgi:hypothetical protein
MRTPVRIAALVTTLAAAGCVAPGPQDQGTVPPELRLEGVRFRVYRKDVLRAFGNSATASLRRDSSELHAHQVETIIPRPDDTPVRVTAPEGQGLLVGRTFEASGGVVITHDDDAGRTERARYEPEPPGGDGEGLVLGDDPVTVTGRGYRLTGNGFTLDPALGTIVVRGRATLLAGLPEGR